MSGKAHDAETATSRRPPRRRHSSLMPQYLELIRCGAKTVEGRICKGIWEDVVPGDEFVFAPNLGPASAPAAATSPSPASVAPGGGTASPASLQPPAPLLVRATTVRRYDTFEGMLRGEGLAACLPGVGSLEAGVALYRAIPGYAAQEAAGLGVVGVGVELVAARFEPEEEGNGDGEARLGR
ncbi:hypothetical protein HYH02_014025 [Chlamydomonas schloesseri]|uniref:Uncharacterized protein n=1 Tax=Chlamydomonas schloesseri TaxID=2026947 RepID=A0A835SLU6_9CHLO|nr:hypothetical protein HYH02_014025 [Chlamydomonas schloesseri]|eukprot:KAG2429443.1 hypothetical protein HYH02_014025 [Chlamydomonas schloesseri]